MAHALEARCPFLDQQVVELAARLPDHWKIRGLFLKKISSAALVEKSGPGSHPLAKQTGFNVPVDCGSKVPCGITFGTISNNYGI